MVSAWPHSLVYDPLGRLVHIDTATGFDRFGYDPGSGSGAGSNLIVEYDGGNNVARRYVHGPGVDEPLVWYEGSGIADRRWLHADERGSVIAVSDGSGSVAGVNAYDEYGIPGASNTGRFQYTGQTWISGVGMYHYRARFYSPTWGRFMQADPIGYGDGMNLYAYVGNDPVNFTDPLGLQRQCRDATTGVGSDVTVHSRCSPFNLNLLQDFANRGFGSYTQADDRDRALQQQERDATRFIPRLVPASLTLCPPVRTRVLQGNPRNIGRPGAFEVPGGVRNGTAAIIYRQWGLTKGELRPYIGGILGMVNGRAIFFGVTDSIDNDDSPVTGMSTQDALMHLNPGAVILEVVGLRRDLGIQMVQFGFSGPLNCPTATGR